MRNPDTGVGGAAVDWYLGHNFAPGSKVATTHIDDLYYMTFGVIPPEVGRDVDFCYRVRGILKPSTSGEHRISLASIGPATLSLDGRQIIQLPGAFATKGSLFFTYGSDETIASLSMTADHEYQVSVEYHSHDRQVCANLQGLLDPMEDKFQGIRLGYEEANQSNLPAEAASMAQNCDAAIVVVGRDKEWETEGQDIPLFELPGDQVELIQRVAEVCQRTIVIIQTGTPVRMEPWISHVQAVLYTWYQGQELGNAAADVVCGISNPSGRLPITFPKRLEDCPAFSSFPGKHGEVTYSEDIYVGYKWWDIHNIEPQFPFAFGLSYSTFEVKAAGNPSPKTLASHCERLSFPVQVHNTGGSSLPCQHTVILWQSGRLPKGISRPKKQVCGFAKSRLLTRDEEQSLAVEVDAYAFGLYDVARELWVIPANSEFDILLGSDAQRCKVAWSFTVAEEITWIR